MVNLPKRHVESHRSHTIDLQFLNPTNLNYQLSANTIYAESLPNCLKYFSTRMRFKRLSGKPLGHWHAFQECDKMIEETELSTVGVTTGSVCVFDGWGGNMATASNAYMYSSAVRLVRFFCCVFFFWIKSLANKQNVALQQDLRNDRRHGIFLKGILKFNISTDLENVP